LGGIYGETGNREGGNSVDECRIKSWRKYKNTVATLCKREKDDRQTINFQTEKIVRSLGHGVFIDFGRPAHNSDSQDNDSFDDHDFFIYF
jgi:hypothetical protein